MRTRRVLVGFASASAFAAVVLVCVTASGALASAAPPNDNLSSAIFLEAANPAIGFPGTFTGDSTLATTETGETTMPLNVPHTNSVWFAFQEPPGFAPTGGTLTVDTAGSSYDTILDVRPFATTIAGVGPPLVLNDDVSSTDHTSRIEITLTPAEVVLIGLYGHGAGGSYQVNTSFTPYPRPPNDDKAAPLAVSGSTGSTSGDTTHATLESGESPNVPGVSLGHSVWFLWTAPAVGTVTFDTAGSAYDTFLESGSVWNNDAAAGVLTSRLQLPFDVAAGDTILVGLYGVGTDAGSYTLSWSMDPPIRPPNDNFADAQVFPSDVPAVGGQISYSADATEMLGATTEPGEPDQQPSVWYEWTAPPGATTAFLDIVNTVGFPTSGGGCCTTASVVAYTGSSVSDLTAVGPGWIPIAGVTYHIRVSGSVRFVLLGFGVTIEADATPPTVTPTVTGALGDNGWYTSDVTASWGIGDPDSPISSSSGCGVTTVSTDTDASGVTLTCTATSAGGTTTRSVTIKRDATPPIGVTTVLNRGPDHNGWCTAQVGWTTAGSDASSGIATCSSGSYFTPDSSSASVAGTCTDNAGNTSAPASTSFQYDAIGPTVKIVLARPRDHANSADGRNWFNHPIGYTVDGFDDVSGIAGCDPDGTYSGPDTADVVVTAGCSDNAGHITVGTISFNYDGSAPTVAVTLGRATDANGWYNHAVSYSTAGADAQSGIESCSPDRSYIGPDSGSATVSGSCTNGAGLTTSGSVSYRYDATPPPIAITAPADGAVYLLGQTATALYACGPDSASGLASCLGPSTLDTASIGAQSFTVTAADNAGNASTKKVAYIVQYAPQGQSCNGDAGHVILQPINADGSSVFKQGSTVAAKFRVCDTNGVSIGAPGLIAEFKLIQTIAGSISTVNEAVDTMTSDTAFRWDSVTKQWIFNISTKALSANEVYVYRITLNDGSTINFRFSLK